jgi:hypothetical protein
MLCCAAVLIVLLLIAASKQRMSQTLSVGWEALCRLKLEKIASQNCDFEIGVPTTAGKSEWKASGGPQQQGWPSRRHAYSNHKTGLFVAANNAHFNRYALW